MCCLAACECSRMEERQEGAADQSRHTVAEPERGAVAVAEEGEEEDEMGNAEAEDATATCTPECKKKGAVAFTPTRRDMEAEVPPGILAEVSRWQRSACTLCGQSAMFYCPFCCT